MDEIRFEDFLKPFSLNEYERAWKEQCEQNAREIAEVFAIPMPVVSSGGSLRAVDFAELLAQIKEPPSSPYPNLSSIYTGNTTAPVVNPSSLATWTIATPNSTAPMWMISPETYESIKLAHLFPQPTRKLRRVQLRRLYARKRRYKAHRARVNAAIQSRLGVVS